MRSRTARHLAPGIDVRVSCRQAVGFTVKAVTSVLLAVTAVLMVATAVGTFVFNIGISPVLTGSMRGTFDPGAMVVTRPVPAADVAAGDVLVFQPPGHAERYTHRVLTVTPSAGGPVITTKGDANPAPDPWKAQLPGPVAHEVVLSMPHVGRAMVLVQSGDLRPFLLAFAGLVFTVMGTRAVLGSSRSTRTSAPTPSYAA